MSLEDRLYPFLTAYQQFPESWRLILGSAYRKLPPRVRFGKNYATYVELAESCVSWSVSDLEDYQFGEMRRILLHARDYCPFYRDAFRKAGFNPEEMSALTDLKACPLLTKQDLLQNLEQMSSTAILKKQRLYITTGGSTGVPVGFHLQKGVSRPKEQAFLEAQWKRAGYFDGARLAVIRGHVTSEKARGSIMNYDATRDWLMLSSSHLTNDRLPDYLEAMENFKPDILHAYPSAALQLAEYLERAGQQWRLPLKCLLCGSERLDLAQKRLLERVFRTKVYRWYGHSERVVLAGEGVTSELFYFWPTYGFVEFGLPDEHGLSEVIGTSFHNEVMPLIRYRTGDYVRVQAPDGDQKAEYPWPAVSEISGREQEFLVTATGRRVSLTAFNMHDQIFDGLYAVQFYQEQPGCAEFRYVSGPDFHASRLTDIEKRIRRKLGEDFSIELRAVKETEKTSRGKSRWLISKLD